ncbi:MAG: CHASE2 domain-containing protein [Pseudomonadota bacterium]
MNRGSRYPRKPGVILLCGGFITLLFCLASIYRPSLLSLVGLKVYDSMVRALPQSMEKNGPVVIDLDEKSLAEFGQWPWPRYRVAQLLDKLNSLEPKAVGLDILFAEPDRTSLHVLQQELKRDFDATMTFEGSPLLPVNNDLALAQSLLQGPFVSGFKFFFDGDVIPGRDHLLHPIDIVYQQGQSLLATSHLFEARDVVANLPELSGAVTSSGFLNYPADDDGVLRRVPLLIRYQEKLYPSLALATAMQALGRKSLILDMENDRLQTVMLDSRRIPVDAAGNILLAYRGKGRFFEYISAADILHDGVAKDRIQGKTVFVGTSATGLMDVHPTPLDPLYPGVEVHATIVENIMNSHFLSRPLWAGGVELGTVFLFGLISSLILAAARPLVSVLFLVLGGVGLWYGSFFLLDNQAVFVNPLWAFLALFVNFAILSLMKFWQEEREVRKRTRELLLAQDTTILSLTALAETRDNETGAHILRTQHYVRVLAEHLARRPKYKKHLDWSTIDMLFRSAPLHDIGKVGVSDSILLNPGKLTPEEFEAMKKHTVYGHETLLKAETLLRDEAGHSFLRVAGDIAYTHHEKWDGSGYPRGLKGEAIPLAGRLMALADVYDALISARRYKPAFTHREALQIVQEGSGSHFDPDVVKAFLAMEESFHLIAQHFSDEMEFGKVPLEPLDI